MLLLRDRASSPYETRGTYYIGVERLGQEQKWKFQHAKALSQLIQGAEKKSSFTGKQVSVNQEAKTVNRDGRLTKFKELWKQKDFEVSPKERRASADRLSQIY